jgi:hypothetical protein
MPFLLVFDRRSQTGREKTYAMSFPVSVLGLRQEDQTVQCPFPPYPPFPKRGGYIYTIAPPAGFVTTICIKSL